MTTVQKPQKKFHIALHSKELRDAITIMRTKLNVRSQEEVIKVLVEFYKKNH